MESYSTRSNTRMEMCVVYIKPAWGSEKGNDVVCMDIIITTLIMYPDSWI